MKTLRACCKSKPWCVDLMVALTLLAVAAGGAFVVLRAVPWAWSTL